MFQLRQLKIFLAAAETLSFTQAGRRIHLSQPAVTEQVRALEAIVGRPLFVRQHNVLALTEAGRRLAVHARELLALADAALQAVQDPTCDDGGALSVAAPQTLGTALLMPLLAPYLDERPGVRLEILERNSAATCQLVADGEAALGLIHGWPADGAAVRATPIARDLPVVLLPLHHPLADAGDISPDQLARFPLVLTRTGCSYRRYADMLLQQASARPQVRGVADSVPALVHMVAAGLGIAVLPRMAARSPTHNAAAAGQVVVRYLAQGGNGLPICALIADRPPTPRLAALIDLLRLAASASDEPVAAFDVQHGARRVAVPE